MIKIIKGLEPISLTTYKRSFNATYDDLDKSCKDDIRVHLLREQKNICAYCMGKININNMKIEHYIPRNEETGDSTKQLEYINLLQFARGEKVPSLTQKKLVIQEKLISD